MEDQDWLASARPVEAVTVDVGFVIHPSFYYGPVEHITREQWLTLQDPLVPPRGERLGNLLLTRSLDNPAIDDLVRYYQDVLGRYAAHGLDHHPDRWWYFDLGVVIFSPDVFTLHLDLIRTWRHIESTFRALTVEADGVLFDDLDQGWEFTAYAAGDRLYLRAEIGGVRPELICVVCDRLAFAQQAREARQRGRKVLGRVQRRFGHNFWPRR
jgi:hypothetical protein